MPNWNYNAVTISAPLEQVKKYFVKDKEGYHFNMYLLFPERFEATDVL